jgi:hypothetical protein
METTPYQPPSAPESTPAAQGSTPLGGGRSCSHGAAGRGRCSWDPNLDGTQAVGIFGGGCLPKGSFERKTPSTDRRIIKGPTGGTLR